MTDSPDQPPKPHPERTAQLAALVEEIPEDDASEGASDTPGEDDGSGDTPGYEGGPEDGDFAGPQSQVPLVSRPPPLLPKEKTQVRNRAFVIGGVFFVVCVVLAIAVVIAIGHGTPAPVATRPVVRPPPPAVVAAPPPVHHTHITLDEIVFTSDAGPAHP